MGVEREGGERVHGGDLLDADRAGIAATPRGKHLRDALNVSRGTRVGGSSRAKTPASRPTSPGGTRVGGSLRATTDSVRARSGSRGGDERAARIIRHRARRGRGVSVEGVGFSIQCSGSRV